MCNAEPIWYAGSYVTTHNFKQECKLLVCFECWTLTVIMNVYK
jgi:hypothetical protein